MPRLVLVLMAVSHALGDSCSQPYGTDTSGVLRVRGEEIDHDARTDVHMAPGHVCIGKWPTNRRKRIHAAPRLPHRPADAAHTTVCLSSGLVTALFALFQAAVYLSGALSFLVFVPGAVLISAALVSSTCGRPTPSRQGRSTAGDDPCTAFLECIFGGCVKAAHVVARATARLLHPLACGAFPHCELLPHVILWSPVLMTAASAAVQCCRITGNLLNCTWSFSWVSLPMAAVCVTLGCMAGCGGSRGARTVPQSLVCVTRAGLAALWGSGWRVLERLMVFFACVCPTDFLRLKIKRTKSPCWTSVARQVVGAVFSTVARIFILCLCGAEAAPLASGFYRELAGLPASVYGLAGLLVMGSAFCLLMHHGGEGGGQSASGSPTSGPSHQRQGGGAGHECGGGNGSQPDGEGDDAGEGGGDQDGGRDPRRRSTAPRRPPRTAVWIWVKAVDEAEVFSKAEAAKIVTRRVSPNLVQEQPPWPNCVCVEMDGTTPSVVSELLSIHPPLCFRFVDDMDGFGLPNGPGGQPLQDNTDTPADDDGELPQWPYPYAHPGMKVDDDATNAVHPQMTGGQAMPLMNLPPAANAFPPSSDGGPTSMHRQEGRKRGRDRSHPYSPTGLQSHAPGLDPLTAALSTAEGWRAACKSPTEEFSVDGCINYEPYKEGTPVLSGVSIRLRLDNFPSGPVVWTPWVPSTTDQHKLDADAKNKNSRFSLGHRWRFPTFGRWAGGSDTANYERDGGRLPTLGGRSYVPSPVRYKEKDVFLCTHHADDGDAPCNVLCQDISAHSKPHDLEKEMRRWMAQHPPPMSISAQDVSAKLVEVASRLNMRRFNVSKWINAFMQRWQQASHSPADAPAAAAAAAASPNGHHMTPGVDFAHHVKGVVDSDPLNNQGLRVCRDASSGAVFIRVVGEPFEVEQLFPVGPEPLAPTIIRARQHRDSNTVCQSEPPSTSLSAPTPISMFPSSTGASAAHQASLSYASGQQLDQPNGETVADMAPAGPPPPEDADCEKVLFGDGGAAGRGR
ncbi:unnamed protein product [Vitrella brassicaformis CCMP3155]|uniref:HTH CENPB-type domain-containing protein n=1 Tax=Vitrella brassicaformis (strain CCMP3155) TaxID=1169540 RepID=A0A0G4EHT5_VITBC|nr:unnamed protein product [Vitrella brassicaformis CCMP3155]|eukprot:CEL95755.1 unnamed protein product [Vitrella brassicaformis CCMP3155]